MRGDNDLLGYSLNNVLSRFQILIGKIILQSCVCLIVGKPPAGESALVKHAVLGREARHPFPCRGIMASRGNLSCRWASPTTAPVIPYLKVINLELSCVLPSESNEPFPSLIKGDKLFEHHSIRLLMCAKPRVTKEFNQTTSLIKTPLPELNDVIVAAAHSFTFKKAGQSVHSS